MKEKKERYVEISEKKRDLIGDERNRLDFKWFCEFLKNVGGSETLSEVRVSHLPPHIQQQN